MQFSWTLALPMTLVIFYFLYKIVSYFIRIYRRFRLAPDSVVTGAFNADGAGTPMDQEQAPTDESRRQPNPPLPRTQRRTQRRRRCPSVDGLLTVC